MTPSGEDRELARQAREHNLKTAEIWLAARGLTKPLLVENLADLIFEVRNDARDQEREKAMETREKILRWTGRA